MKLATEESVASIQQWARDAFGPAPVPSRIAARANEEMQINRARRRVVEDGVGKHVA